MPPFHGGSDMHTSISGKEELVSTVFGDYIPILDGNAPDIYEVFMSMKERLDIE